MILLAVRDRGKNLVIDRNSMVKSEILTKTHVINLKLKLRTCRIQYQVGKVSFVSKKMKKIILKRKFQRVTERAKMFLSVKKILKKKFQK